MRTLWTAILIAAVATAGCTGFERAETAAKAKHSMIGMTKEQVLTCMGPPARQASAGTTDAWAYASDDGATYGKISGDRVTTFGDGQCIVNVLFERDRVSSVKYLGQTSTAGTLTGAITEDDQCAYAVKQCIQ